MSEAFDELARTLRLQSTEVALVDLGKRWGKRLPYLGKARVYAAMRGAGWVGVEKQGFALRQGELLFLPRGDAHSVRDRPSTDLSCADAYCRAIRRVGEHELRTEATPDTRLVVADLHFDTAGAPWLSLLPSFVHIERSMPGLSRWLGETLRLLSDARDLSPSLRDGILETFGQTLFACALRRLSVPVPGTDALRDEFIAAALVEVRAAPEVDWELGELSRKVGLSRSAFAARVTAMLGEPLGSYVRRLRLERAAAQLSGTTLPVKIIASHVGYHSEAAFTRAFTRVHGKSPRAYRDERRGRLGSRFQLETREHRCRTSRTVEG